MTIIALEWRDADGHVYGGAVECVTLPEHLAVLRLLWETKLALDGLMASIGVMCGSEAEGRAEHALMGLQDRIEATMKAAGVEHHE